jgi:hypothetical protein
VDSRADIYSLGVVFYEMLTGELPGKRLEPPSRKVQIDVRLDEVVLRALERNPDLRYQQVSEVKTMVETIVGTSPSQNEPAVRNRCVNQGVDYRSKATLFGLPLLHVTSGLDPQTGRVRVAKGIIAIGDRAQGVVAFGGVAMGGFAFGGLAMGVFAFGGCALGLIAFGGLAIALFAALGGGAIAPIAIGGGAVGFLAFGGGAIGAHVLDAATKDPAAERFFLPWAKVLMANTQWFTAIFITLVIGIGVGVPLWLRRRMLNMVETIAGTPDTNSSQRRDAQTDVPPSHQDWWTWSPLQSQQVGEICAHLTKAERNFFSLLGLLASVWVVGTIFGIPAFLRSNSGSGKWIVASVWVVLFAVSIQMLHRMVRYFLCSTIWARERGFKSENLRLFSFNRKNLWKLGLFLAVGLALVFAQNKAITRYLGLESLPAPDQIQKRPSKSAEAMPRFYIGQADFPHGDSIEITSVDRTPNWIAVKGHYNLVSHDQATLALYITSTNLTTWEDSEHEMRISKGRGYFALIHSHLVPGLPRVAMVADGENIADLYFGTKAEAAEERRMDFHPTWSFGPVMERTLRINGDECDFLVLRTGEVLRHSFVDTMDLNGSPPSAVLQWAREKGVDVGIGSSSNTHYGPVGIQTFDMGTFPFSTDTVSPDQIPDFHSEAELLAYSAQHGWPQKRLVGSLVGVTNIWNDLKAAQFHGQPNDIPGFFLKEKHPLLWFSDPANTNYMHFTHPIAFSTRDGIEGLIQVTDFTSNPPSIKLRYKLVQIGGREK